MRKVIYSSLLVGTLFLSLPVYAATLTVNVTNDPDVLGSDDTCSLRQAIQAANTDSSIGNCGSGDAGLDVINFSNPSATYELTIDSVSDDDNLSGDLDLCSNIQLNGGGMGTTIVLANFPNTPDRVFDISEDLETCIPDGGFAGTAPAVEINGITIEGGEAITDFQSIIGGGGVRNAGVLALNQVEIQNNDANNTNDNNNDVRGGGLLNMGEATVVASSIHDNDIISDTGEGAEAAGGGIASILRDLGNVECALLVDNTQINANTVTEGAGGGLSNEDCDGMVLMSAIFNNQVLGDEGNASLIPGSGGGVYNALTGSEASLNITDSTISTNSAVENGGGIAAVDSLPNEQIQLNSVTVALNVADSDSDTTGNGGGIFRGRSLGNLPGSFNLQNTIVSENTAEAGPDCDQDADTQIFNSFGFNLIRDQSDCAIGGATANDLPAGSNPNLGPLADNGGLTLTHALLSGSQAIDAANPAGCTDDVNGGTDLLFDQRDDPFDRVVAGVIGGTPRCDVGAFEFEPSPAPSPTPSPTAAPVPPNLILRGTGLLPCSLQKGPISSSTAYSLAVMLGGTLLALAWGRSRKNG